MLTLSGDDFAFLAHLLQRRSGLFLTPAKAGLFERRLRPVVRRFGFKDLKALVCQLRLGQETLAAAVTEAMTVNDTSFFRDDDAFAQLRDHGAAPLAGGARRDKRLCGSGPPRPRPARKPIPSPCCWIKWGSPQKAGRSI